MLLCFSLNIFTCLCWREEETECERRRKRTKKWLNCFSSSFFLASFELSILKMLVWHPILSLLISLQFYMQTTPQIKLKYSRIKLKGLPSRLHSTFSFLFFLYWCCLNGYSVFVLHFSPARRRRDLKLTNCIPHSQQSL